MNEATLKRALVQTLRRRVGDDGMVFRHEDQFTGGIPDISVTLRDLTAWIEVKYARRGRRSVPTPLQLQSLTRLRGFLLTYREDGEGRTTLLRRFPRTGTNVRAGKFDHEWVAEQILQVLGR